jgi:hypothetical protein
MERIREGRERFFNRCEGRARGGRSRGRERREEDGEMPLASTSKHTYEIVDKNYAAIAAEYHRRKHKRFAFIFWCITARFSIQSTVLHSALSPRTQSIPNNPLFVVFPATAN